MGKIQPGRRLLVSVTRQEIPVDLEGGSLIGLVGEAVANVQPIGPRVRSGAVTHVGTTQVSDRYFVLRLDHPMDGLSHVYVTDEAHVRHLLLPGGE